MGAFVIYGATGYSGRLIAARACGAGLAPVLSGRNPAALEPLAASLGVPWRAASSSDPGALETAFAGARIVLNAAGPFSRTAEAVLGACLRAGAHYLDIAGESGVIERLARHRPAARDRRLMVMPAVGFSVVATDCLAVHVARRLPGATDLAVAVTQPRALSAGSARTLLENTGLGIVRRHGSIAQARLGTIERHFDFGSGRVPAVNASLADVVTAHYSTGIPNVTAFVEATPIVRAALAASRIFGSILATPACRPWLDAGTAFLPDAPLAVLDGRGSAARVVAVASDGRGHRACARLRAPGPYDFTADAAVALTQRVLAGDVEPGFETPGRVYGADFVLQLPGVSREDLE